MISLQALELSLWIAPSSSLRRAVPSAEQLRSPQLLVAGVSVCRVGGDCAPCCPPAAPCRDLSAEREHRPRLSGPHGPRESSLACHCLSPSQRSRTRAWHRGVASVICQHVAVPRASSQSLQAVAARLTHPAAKAGGFCIASHSQVCMGRWVGRRTPRQLKAQRAAGAPTTQGTRRVHAHWGSGDEGMPPRALIVPLAAGIPCSRGDGVHIGA